MALLILIVIALIPMVLFLSFIGFHLFIKRTFHTEVLITAPVEDVWSLLLNESGYKEWNTVLVPMEGKIEQGKKLKYEMTNEINEKSLITIKVKRSTENKELNQVGGIPGFLTFNHKYILEPMGNATKLVQHEVDRGIGLLFWDSSWIEPAYEQTSKNLKKILDEGR